MDSNSEHDQGDNREKSVPVNATIPKVSQETVDACLKRIDREDLARSYDGVVSVGMRGWLHLSQGNRALADMILRLASAKFKNWDLDSMILGGGLLYEVLYREAEKEGVVIPSVNEATIQTTLWADMYLNAEAEAYRKGEKTVQLFDPNFIKNLQEKEEPGLGKVMQSARNTIIREIEEYPSTEFQFDIPSFDIAAEATYRCLQAGNEVNQLKGMT